VIRRFLKEMDALKDAMRMLRAGMEDAMDSSGVLFTPAAFKRQAKELWLRKSVSLPVSRPGYRAVRLDIWVGALNLDDLPYGLRRYLDMIWPETELDLLKKKALQKEQE
jgi:hypothetical protein